MSQEARATNGKGVPAKRRPITNSENLSNTDCNQEKSTA